MNMMHDKRKNRLGLPVLLLGSAMMIAGVSVGATAQEKNSNPPSVKTRSYSTGRDPFKKYEPPKVSDKKVGSISVPSIQERISLYKAQKAAAMNARMPAPKPTTALLLSEIQVIGISRTPRGYAAIVQATPIHLSYVIYPGEPFFDGQLVAIDDNRLIFRRETVLLNGRRERSVEIKPLRGAADSMAAGPAESSASTSKP
jgi:hypothetical protein